MEVEEVQVEEREILIKIVHRAVVNLEEGDHLMMDKDKVGQEEGVHNNQTIRQMEEALEDREVVEVDDIAEGRDNRAIT